MIPTKQELEVFAAKFVTMYISHGFSDQILQVGKDGKPTMRSPRVNMAEGNIVVNITPVGSKAEEEIDVLLDYPGFPNGALTRIARGTMSAIRATVGTVVPEWHQTLQNLFKQNVLGPFYSLDHIQKVTFAYSGSKPHITKPTNDNIEGVTLNMNLYFGTVGHKLVVDTDARADELVKHFKEHPSPRIDNERMRHPAILRAAREKLTRSLDLLKARKTLAEGEGREISQGLINNIAKETVALKRIELHEGSVAANLPPSSGGASTTERRQRRVNTNLSPEQQDFIDRMTNGQLSAFVNDAGADASLQAYARARLAEVTGDNTPMPPAPPPRSTEPMHAPPGQVKGLADMPTAQLSELYKDSDDINQRTSIEREMEERMAEHKRLGTRQKEVAAIIDEAHGDDYAAYSITVDTNGYIYGWDHLPEFSAEEKIFIINRVRQIRDEGKYYLTLCDRQDHMYDEALSIVWDAGEEPEKWISPGNRTWKEHRQSQSSATGSGGKDDDDKEKEDDDADEAEEEDDDEVKEDDDDAEEEKEDIRSNYQDIYNDDLYFAFINETEPTEMQNLYDEIIRRVLKGAWPTIDGMLATIFNAQHPYVIPYDAHFLSPGKKGTPMNIHLVHQQGDHLFQAGVDKARDIYFKGASLPSASEPNRIAKTYIEMAVKKGIINGTHAEDDDRGDDTNSQSGTSLSFETLPVNDGPTNLDDAVSAPPAAPAAADPDLLAAALQASTSFRTQGAGTNQEGNGAPHTRPSQTQPKKAAAGAEAGAAGAAATDDDEDEEDEAVFTPAEIESLRKRTMPDKDPDATDMIQLILKYANSLPENLRRLAFGATNDKKEFEAAIDALNKHHDDKFGEGQGPTNLTKKGLEKARETFETLRVPIYAVIRGRGNKKGGYGLTRQQGAKTFLLDVYNKDYPNGPFGT